MTAERRFEEFCARKTREAESAHLAPLATIEDSSSRHPVSGIGTAWTRRIYDGDFHLFALPADVPAASLVFIQSRDGSTEARDPAVFGGGAVDKHLLYEGLSRVAADAVLAGAATASGREVFFSVWLPELVSLRVSLGLPRHPAQIVVTGSGRYDAGRLLAASVPAAPLFIITSEEGHERLAPAVAGRPWIRILAMSGDDLRQPLRTLRAAHGIARISVIGGRRIATALVDDDLIQDVYLTTTTISAGEPGTPFYTGARALAFSTIVAKRGLGSRGPLTFEHLAIEPPRRPPSRTGH